MTIKSEYLMLQLMRNASKKRQELRLAMFWKEWRIFLKDVSMYVFSDFEFFAEKVGKKNIHVVSFGGIDFLKKKIVGSKIAVCVDSIKVIDYEKSKAIKELFDGGVANENEKLFFLDDRVDQIRDVKEKFPKIVTILVRRSEGRYQDMQKESCCDHEVKNLEEAQLIINSLGL